MHGCGRVEVRAGKCPLLVAGILFFFLTALLAAGQTVTGDSRWPGLSPVVPAPSYPALCSVEVGSNGEPHGVLYALQTASSFSESALDTTRLTTAFSDCTPAAGQPAVAVELALNPSSTSCGTSACNAFLSGSLTLPAGVTLLIDPDVTLYADKSTQTNSQFIYVASNSTAYTGGSMGYWGIMGYGIIDGYGTSTSFNDSTKLITLNNSNYFTLYQTTLQNAQKEHLIGAGSYLLAYDAKISTPANTSNTDGIDPSGPNNVTIVNSYFNQGDDHIAFNAGGTHIDGATIAYNHLYSGHGISIGSYTTDGMENMLVTQNVLDNNGGYGSASKNALRIKSDSANGGEVKNILYDSMCIQNGGHILIFNPYYDGSTGTNYPNFHDITLQNINVVNHDSTSHNGASALEGYDTGSVLNPLKNVTFNNVVFNYTQSQFTGEFYPEATVGSEYGINYATFILGPDQVSFNSAVWDPMNGEDGITVTDDTGSSSTTYSCTGKFTYLAGELFAAGSTGAPLAPPLTVSPGSSVTLRAIVQPIVKSTYSSSSFTAPATNGTLTFYDGSTSLGTKSVSGNRITNFTVSNVTAGTHNYTVTYSGDTNYVSGTGGCTPSSSKIVCGAAPAFPTVTVIAGSTSTVVACSPASPAYGQTSTCTATVSPTGGSGTPTGTATFTLDGTSEGAVTLSSASAAWSESSVAPGSHTVCAAYSGDSNFTSSSGCTTLTIGTATVTASVTASGKTYDGTATAAISSCTLSGVVGSDSVTCSAAGPNTFADKNVGASKVVTATNISLSGSSAGNYTLASTSAATTAAITARPITVTAAANSKTYDATTTASATPAITSGSLASGDTASWTETYGTKTVGTGKTLTPAGSVSDGNSGNNYSVTFVPVTSGIISSATLTVTGITAANKTYDGTATATLSTGSAALAGVMSGDSVTLSTAGATGTFASVNAGTGIVVQVAGLTISGTDAGNYTLTQPTTTANITQAAVTASVTAGNKAYDSTTTEPIANTTCNPNVLAADQGNVTCAGTAATFASANVGNGITVTVSGISLSGSAAGNYALSSTSATTTANITLAAVTASVAAGNKTYDSTTTEPIANVTCTLTPSESNLSCAGTAAAFASANVGTGITVTVTGISLSGSAAGNYALSSTTATTTANITAATVTPSVTAQSKTYDGATTEPIANVTCTLTPSESNLSCAETAAAFASANVGTGITVTVTGISLSGSAAGNYTLSSTTATTTANITQAAQTPGVSCYSGLYTGTGEGCTVTPQAGDITCTSGTVTNVPGGSVALSCGSDSNYQAWTGTGTVTITQASQSPVLTGCYSGPYTGSAEGCTGVSGGYGCATQSTWTTYTNVPGGTVSVACTGDTNHTAATAAGTVTITQVSQSPVLTGCYSGPYTGSAEGCTGVSGGFGCPDPSTWATYTNAPGGTVSVACTGDTNHTAATAAGTVTITQVSQSPVLTGCYSGPYTGSAEGCTGVSGGFGCPAQSTWTTYTNVPGGTVSVACTGDTNHTAATAAGTVTITQVSQSPVLTGCYSGPYTGSAEGCTGVSGGFGCPAQSTWTTYTNVSGGTVSVACAGDTNHTAGTATGTVTISQASQSPVLTGCYSGPYTGSAEGCTGVSGGYGCPAQSTWTTYTNVSGGTVSVACAGDTNHTAGTATGTVTITQASQSPVLTGCYSGPYTGSAEGCTGVTGGYGCPDPSTWTTYTNVSGGTVSVACAGDTNHAAATAAGTVTITQVSQSPVLTGCYSGPYTGSAEGCTGVSGGFGCPAQSTWTTYTNVSGGTVSVACAGDTNHAAATAAGTVTITQVSQSPVLTGCYSGPYTGSAEGCTGVNGGFGCPDPSTWTTYTNVSGGTVSVACAGDTNHTAATAAGTVTITQASQSPVLTGCYSGPYTGSAEGCTGVNGGFGCPAPSTWTAYTNVSGGTVSVACAGDTNHTAATAAGTVTIQARTVIPGIQAPAAMTYNTGTAETGTVTCTLSNVVSSDQSTLRCNVTSASFNCAHVSCATTVTANVGLGGSPTGDYTLSTSVPTTGASIVPASVPALSVNCGGPYVETGSPIACPSSGGSAAGLGTDGTLTGSWTFCYVGTSATNYNACSPPSLPDSYTVTGTFTPSDTDYKATSAPATAMVITGTQPLVPTITYVPVIPAAGITYLTPLAAAQLCKAVTVTVSEDVKSGSSYKLGTVSLTTTAPSSISFTDTTPGAVDLVNGSQATTWGCTDSAVLNAGAHYITATWSPNGLTPPVEGTNPTTYTTVTSAAAPVTIGQYTPVLTFSPKVKPTYPISTTDTAKYLIPTAAVKATKATIVGSFTYSDAYTPTGSTAEVFTLNPLGGDLLGAGQHVITATFAPQDQTDYAAGGTVTATINVKQGKLKITFPTTGATPIPDGVALDSSYFTAITQDQYSLGTDITYEECQGGAIAYTVAGSPAGPGSVLGVGSNAIGANCPLQAPGTIPLAGTPAVNYPAPLPGTEKVTVVAEKYTFAKTTVTWPNSDFEPVVTATDTAASPAAIACNWTYMDTFTPKVNTPSGAAVQIYPGQQLQAGAHAIVATCAPTGSDANYVGGSAAATWTVKPGTLTVAYPAGPAPIPYGTGLSSAYFQAITSNQVNPGTDISSTACTGGISYTLGSPTGAAVTPGEVLQAGSYKIYANCTSSDLNDYPSPASVKITVAVSPYPVLGSTTPALAELISFNPTTPMAPGPIGAAQTVNAVSVINNPLNNEQVFCAWTFSPAEGVTKTSNFSEVATCVPQMASGDTANPNPNYVKGAITMPITVQ
jgi:hypothetical protein